MFQYAFAKRLSIELNSSLSLDYSLLSKYPKGKEKSTNRDFELGIFNLTETTKISKRKRIMFKILNTLNGIMVNLGCSAIQTSFYYAERNISFCTNINTISKNCYIIGYWQSYKYFESIEHIIRKEFKFPPFCKKQNHFYSKQIQESNSVAVHIRRGDFLHEKNQSVHGICSIEYYQNAIRIISNLIANPTFFIFSDDSKWVIDNFNISYEKFIVTGNFNTNSFRDMQLMSMCKHNIIANSSFSWWGAWLNSNPSKIVIAPKNWYSATELNELTEDLIPKEWKKI